MNATEQYFPVVLFFIPYKVALLVAINRRDHFIFPNLATLVRMTTCIGWIIHQIKSTAVVERASILMALS